MHARRLALAVAALLLAARTAAAAPPVINCPAPIETFETAQLQTVITASDPDNDPVTMRCVNPPFRASFDPPSGIFSWVPYYTQSGTYDIQFQAIAAGETTGCTYHIVVDNLDRPPALTCPPTQIVNYLDTLKVALTATDPDHDPLTWSATNLPAGATLSPGGVFTWPTINGSIGSYTIPISVSDGTLSASCFLAVNVIAANLPPRVYCPGPLNVPALTTINVTIPAASPTGGPITLTATGVPQGALFDGAFHLFNWTPSLTQGGVYQVVFTATDAQHRVATCTTLINVGASFVQPPQFTNCPGTVNGTELGSTDFTLAATDPQSLAITYGSAAALPTGATLNPATGAFHWIPTVGQAGGYNVTFTASNSVKVTNCPVHFTIAAVHPPTFTLCPGTQSGPELSTLLFQVSATEPQGFPLTLSATGPPPGATFNAGTGVFTWTPVIGQAGGYDVTFKATSIAGQAACPVHLTIFPLNPAQPSIQCPAPVQAVESTTIAFTVTASDPQSRSLTLGLTNPPPGATFSTIGQFSWKPSITQAGVYTLHFTVTNGFLSNACDVVATVTNRANTAPHVTCPTGFSTSANRAVAFAVPAVDAEGDAVTYLSRSLPPGATYASGQFTWAPTDASVGTWTPEFIATDTELRDSCKVTLEVVAHPGAVQPLEPVLAHVKDVRPDQGGWVRVTLVASPGDSPASASVTAYGLWRRIEGPDAQAGTRPPALPSSASGARAPVTAAAPAGTVGSVVAGAQALGLGFPAGTWESVAYTPALQAPNLFIVAPTRDDSSAAGRPYEVFVATAHTSNAANWFASAPDSGYSVDDLPPRAPGALAAQPVAGGTRLAWTASPDADLDHYAIFRGTSADFAPDAAASIGDTRDSVFVDATPMVDAWYRVAAIDVHGNAALSEAVAGPSAPAWGVHGVALSSPRPNPTRGEAAFDLVLPAAGEARIEIIDVRGARVRTLVQGALAAGRTALAWDGRDEAGRRVPSGLYHLRVRAAGVELVRKIVLLR